jgi:hypothetical protein
MIAMSALLGGCSGGGMSDMMPNMSDMKLFPSGLPSLSSSSTARQRASLHFENSGPVPPDQYVDGAGQCSASAVPAAPATPAPATPQTGPATPGHEAAVPAAAGEAQVAAGGVALGMTECQVVGHAGQPSHVEISGGEGPDRKTILTFQSGPWPGIYTFSGGRLKVVEEIPNLKPAKPAPKKRIKKPARQG